jgi:hypothetical protein
MHSRRFLWFLALNVEAGSVESIVSAQSEGKEVCFSSNNDSYAQFSVVSWVVSADNTQFDVQIFD